MAQSEGKNVSNVITNLIIETESISEKCRGKFVLYIWLLKLEYKINI